MCYLKDKDKGYSSLSKILIVIRHLKISMYAHIKTLHPLIRLIIIKRINKIPMVKKTGINRHAPIKKVYKTEFWLTKHLRIL